MDTKIMIKIIMDFKEFDKMVKTYYPLNKSKTRYLIFFNEGYSLFYKYNKKNKSFIRESWRVY